jgi:hypothetical protein
MRHNCSVEDLEFLSAFESFELDAGSFRHREHLRVAYVLLSTHSVEDAHARLKSALLGYLAHLGVGDEKYHETLTRAWLLAVNHFMNQSAPSSCFDSFVANNDKLLDSAIMQTHYSKELLQTPRARRQFVPPDLEPIPPRTFPPRGRIGPASTGD